jgi:hypothetical protein
VDWGLLVGKFWVAILETNCKWRFGAINGEEAIRVVEEK